MYTSQHMYDGANRKIKMNRCRNRYFFIWSWWTQKKQTSLQQRKREGLFGQKTYIPNVVSPLL